MCLPPAILLLGSRDQSKGVQLCATTVGTPG